MAAVPFSLIMPPMQFARSICMSDSSGVPVRAAVSEKVPHRLVGSPASSRSALLASSPLELVPDAEKDGQRTRRHPARPARDRRAAVRLPQLASLRTRR